MSDASEPKPVSDEAGALSAAQVIELRKYEARLSFLKVALGTALVGVVSVLIPGVIQGWDLWFQNIRKSEEISLQREQVRQEAIASFIDLALNEDIEHRMRMAEYFAIVSHPDDRAIWSQYYGDLKVRRRTTKSEILGLEQQRNAIEYKPIEHRSKEESIKLATLKLRLDWLYGEMGRAIRGESVVPTTRELQNIGTASQSVPETSLPRNTDLGPLHPAFRYKLQELIQRLQRENLPFALFEGYRSPNRQAQLWARGRTTPGNKVTWVGPWHSVHNYGVAADLVLFEDGRWSWDNSGDRAEWWDRMHELANEVGLTGIFNATGERLEIPHVQLPDYTSRELYEGNYPPGGDDLWARNLAHHIASWSGKHPPPPANPFENDMSWGESSIPAEPQAPE